MKATLIHLSDCAAIISFVRISTIFRDLHCSASTFSFFWFVFFDWFDSVQFDLRPTLYWLFYAWLCYSELNTLYDIIFTLEQLSHYPNVPVSFIFVCFWLRSQLSLIYSSLLCYQSYCIFLKRDIKYSFFDTFLAASLRLFIYRWLHFISGVVSFSCSPGIIMVCPYNKFILCYNGNLNFVFNVRQKLIVQHNFYV